MHFFTAFWTGFFALFFFLETFCFAIVAPIV